MDFRLKETQKLRFANERGAYIKRGAEFNFLLAYPNLYKVGMSNLGIHIVYDLLNKREDTFCERGFLPESEILARHKKIDTPLFSLETRRNFSDFDIIGFAISFEMDYFNTVEMLKLGRIKILSEDRGEKDPIVIAGGPCATFNPEPLAAFFDCFIIGEGEAVMPRFMDCYKEAKEEGLSRKEILKKFSKVPGVYVPALYEHNYNEDGTVSCIESKEGAPRRVKRMWVENLDEFAAHSVVITEDTEFDLYLIETARGCGRHCRFCMAGYAFRKPRNRSIEVLKKAVDNGKKYGKRIGLMGAAISDYPEIDELAKYILDNGMDMSVASFRADSVTEELVSSLAKGGLKTLTMAPEAGSDKLRKVINKGIEEEHLFYSMKLGIKAGILNFRLYFMIGLPFEEQEDIDAIVSLALRLKRYMKEENSRGTLTLSINPFVPKPCTPFMWVPMENKKAIKEKLRYIEKSLKRESRIKVIFESPREAEVQGILARGDRRLSEAILAAADKGGAKFFLQELKEIGLQTDFYLTRDRGENEIFPWETIDIGVKREYLHNELKKAKNQESTTKCFNGCKRCGVC